MPSLQLKCIRVIGGANLTLDRIYEATGESNFGRDRRFCVLDDTGAARWFPAESFEAVPATPKKVDAEKPLAPLSLPTDSAARKAIPMARGCLDYFPAALAAVAELSKKANDKHNPGEPMHWSRGKSNDHADCILRHLADRGTVDPDDNIRHSVKVAWRALALLQEELEAAGAPLARGAKI